MGWREGLTLPHEPLPKFHQWVINTYQERNMERIRFNKKEKMTKRKSKQQKQFKILN